MQIPSAITSVRLLVLALALALPAQLFAADIVADLPAMKVRDNLLVADGKTIRLRGIDWGWLHLSGTKYSEADMQHLADWSANTVRLAFSYNDLATDANPPAWKEDGFQQLDEVVQWGKKYGVYVILDMHVAPGGQNTNAYTAGGHNLLWTDTTAQDRFVALWAEIAKRYHDHPEVAAYELMNEPDTKGNTDALVALDKRAISAIRGVDSTKIIVVGGDKGSGPDDLTDAIKCTDDNILYTFHWYLNAGHFRDNWLSTAKQQQGTSGTQDWVKVEDSFTAPPNADEMTVLLRSDKNSGSAWFDDVEVKDSSGKVLQSASFDADAEDFRIEKGTSDSITYDPSTGHDKPGSLKVHNATATDYAGWASQYVPVRPGEQYYVSMWVKLDQATGQTYPAAAFFQNRTDINRDTFKGRLGNAINFATKFNVPVWVGEFGCEASDKDYQSQWVSTCVSLFEENGFSWTYWNDKEAGDPHGMALQPENKDGSDRAVNDSLLTALRAGWALSKAP